MSNPGEPTDVEPGKQLTSREKEALANDNARMTQEAHQQAANASMSHPLGPNKQKEIADRVAGKVDRDEFQDV